MYTREDVLGMVAGRELDALVAEHVMELGRYEGNWEDASGKFAYSVHEFCPSTAIESAWEVLEKFKTYQVTKTHQIKLPNGPEDMYRAIVQANKYVAFAITPSLAICRAALLASLLKED